MAHPSLSAGILALCAQGQELPQPAILQVTGRRRPDRRLNGREGAPACGACCAACPGLTPRASPAAELKSLNQKDGKAQRRFRITLSDSLTAVPTMLATQLTDHVDNGSVRKGSIVRVSQLIANEVQGRK